MSESTFFRLLKTPIGDKGETLAAHIAALNETGEAEETYTLDPADFALIPGSPFAYWVGDSVLNRFAALPKMDAKFAVRQGVVTANDFRFVRTWWEIPSNRLGYHADETQQGLGWIHFAKGGTYSLFYSDVHMVLDWENEGERIRNFFKPDGRLASRPQNTEHFFRPGLTWPLRTQRGLNFRALPAGSAFGHKGPAVFAPDDDVNVLAAFLAVMNSLPLQMLVEVQMAFGSYEVGVIQRTPIPADLGEAQQRLAALAHEAHNLQRDRDRSDETTHAFCLPGLVRHRQAEALLEASLTLEAEAQAAQARLAAIQAEIDEIVFDLYGLDESDRALVHAEMDQSQIVNRKSLIVNRKSEIQNLLMWCVGVAFGRWDVRMALDPTLLPPLQGPFDPLPRCAPGALVGPDGLPPAQAADIAPKAWLRARQTVLDLPSIENRKSQIVNPKIAWDGILVDDPTHSSDIVTRVRGVLTLLWGDRAGAIEREACDILGVEGLRDYFRDPRKGFFAFHIKRYSKSRRKAPIYWLLQSEKRNYGIWLYIHRLRPDALFAAGRDYADAKVALEEARLEELQASLSSLPPTDGGDERGGLSGSVRRRREREIERQQRIVTEVTEFRNRLDRVALLNLPPDLNDGVVISIAPLWELVPWKEAQRTWERLVAGEYPWSTMARRMRERSIVKRKK